MLLFAQMGFGQVSDNAVIPVSVTLNSILRLTVTSGGNIQFVVTTIQHYTEGIYNAPRYTTNFVVSSSRDFNVNMTTEHATYFTGLEAGTEDKFLLSNVGFTLTSSVLAADNGIQETGLQELSQGNDIILAASAGGNLDYAIEWELATEDLVGTWDGAAWSGGINANGSLLSQSLPADVYVTNVFLTLAPVP